MLGRRSIIAALFACAASLSWSQDDRSNHYFDITYPEDQDTFTAFGDEITTYNGKEFLLEFTGEISRDGVSMRIVWSSGDGKDTDDFTLTQYKPGDAAFLYRASKRLDNMAYGSNKYRFIATFADGKTREKTLYVFFIHGHVGERAKPVIYLYPEAETEVTVSVAPRGGVTTSIPEMGEAWRVRARPDGALVNVADGTEHPYLFWESKDYGPPNPRTEGFVVARGDVDAWMRGKLSFLGLRGGEIDDCMEYWYPYLTASPFAFVYFHPKGRIDAEAPLSVSPVPDSVIRVYFEYAPLEAPIRVEEQTLSGAARSGFCVVEWGGRRP